LPRQGGKRPAGGGVQVGTVIELAAHHRRYACHGHTARQRGLDAGRFAGTGKTSLICEMVTKLPGRAVVEPPGKAGLWLRRQAWPLPRLTRRSPCHRCRGIGNSRRPRGTLAASPPLCPQAALVVRTTGERFEAAPGHPRGLAAAVPPGRLCGRHNRAVINGLRTTAPRPQAAESRIPDSVTREAQAAGGDAKEASGAGGQGCQSPTLASGQARSEARWHLGGA
jgi:hypothetical protein